MSALVELLDKGMQLGENQHCEYAWNEDDIKEQIVQLSFQLVRTKEDQIEVLSKKFEGLLKTLSENSHKAETQAYISTLFKMLGHTRDIVSGKGEYSLSYMLLYGWYKYYPSLALYALETFVLSESKEAQPYGSWKDIKYFANYCRLKSKNKHHELIEKCVQLINEQLRKDVASENDSDISLCTKWVPREGSKYAWLFKMLATNYCKYGGRVETELKGCYMKYRKIISGLNKKIDTVQIKQCGNTWANIDHNKTTSITVSRNKKAFLNINKKGEQRSFLPDRETCADNFKKYIESRIKSGKEVKGSRVGLNHFTNEALELIRNNNTESVEADLLNSQWRSNSEQNQGLTKMIAMVDTSGSMEGEPLEVALALGIRVAEKSALGKRVLTFSDNPTWHNLEECPNFISMVQKLKTAEWRMSTNFYKALNLILNTLVTHKIPQQDVDGLVLAIFSDMQINQADRSFSDKSMMTGIQRMYEAAGYKCPHILFWNLTSTSGFPCLSNENGASMLSGFSPVLLNLFCEKGIDALETVTPWNLLLDSLNNDRYSKLHLFVKNFFDNE